MYYKTLPNHAKPEFDVKAHFNQFKKRNIIFNASSNYSLCDHHVGCLSFKTVINGEEWYGIGNRQVAVRPRKFLMMNNDQGYSSRIDGDEDVKTLSIFFKEEFDSLVFQDLLYKEESLLDNPFMTSLINPEFFQTLSDIDEELQRKLNILTLALDGYEYSSSSSSSSRIDEYLVFILGDLIRTQVLKSRETKRIGAIKQHTRVEIFKRLCVAKDIIESSYMEQPSLEAISNISCLSIPQLIRHFKSVFHRTPHQYLIHIRLDRAVELLNYTNKPIHEVTWRCGFENVSAFCRAFKSEYGIQPARFRKL